MACMTNYLKDALVKHALLHTSFTSPASVYMAAFRTPPTVTGGGTEATSYTRISILSSLAFSGSGTGGVENSGTVSFTDLPNDTYVGIALFDASTVGNMLVFGQLNNPKTTTDGTLDIPTGDLVVTFA